MMSINDQVVEQLSEIGDLTYADPVDIIGIRLRVQTAKNLLGAGPPVMPSPQPPTWQIVVCKLLLADPVPAIPILNAWASCEGGLGHNNPFNVAAPLDGRWAWTGQSGFWNDLGDGYGVCSFSGLYAGAAACALNMLAHPYNTLIQAIRTGDAQLFVNSSELDTWGTGRDCPKRLLRV